MEEHSPNNRNSQMSTKWLIVGISGVTCGGKTTLAAELNKLFPESVVISQDDYFLDVDDPRHTWIPELNHINFDILTSLDMEKMYEDIKTLISSNGTSNMTNGYHKSPAISLEEYSKAELQKMINSKLKVSNTNLLIVEGFCIFNYRPIEYLCNLKFFFQLQRDECLARRLQRVYEPPDCPGYFDRCVWPEYLKQLEDVRQNVQNVKYFDENAQEPITEVLLDILKALESE